MEHSLDISLWKCCETCKRQRSIVLLKCCHRHVFPMSLDWSWPFVKSDLKYCTFLLLTWVLNYVKNDHKNIVYANLSWNYCYKDKFSHCTVIFVVVLKLSRCSGQIETYSWKVHGGQQALSMHWWHTTPCSISPTVGLMTAESQRHSFAGCWKEVWTWTEHDVGQLSGISLSSSLHFQFWCKRS